ncbi:peptide transporter ptr2 [Diplodia intermedia]|uniref:Peptide transporter ptr2 n=1 Tax=Diplodia intermedia TaxID=856260 RepID=A0ABR3TTV9_9PEZI
MRTSAALPQAQAERHGREVSWTAEFVGELAQGLAACRIMCVGGAGALFPVHWLCWNQTFSNLVSQAAQMQNPGIPNDMLWVLNPAVCIVLVPVLQRGLYPALHRRRVRCGPVARIAVGFAFMTASVAYAAVVQLLIYRAGPCYRAPLACPAAAAAAGPRPNAVSVFVQLPVYVLSAAAEVFCLPAGAELAYALAPPGMRSVVQALWSSTAGVGAWLGIAVAPAAEDPRLVALYAGLAGAMALATAIFWICFGRL